MQISNNNNKIGVSYPERGEEGETLAVQRDTCVHVRACTHPHRIFYYIIEKRGVCSCVSERQRQRNRQTSDPEESCRQVRDRTR